MLNIGLAIHSKHISICVLSETGQGGALRRLFAAQRQYA
jgi:hypothetical protein